jgi:hypothetical protein
MVFMAGLAWLATRRSEILDRINRITRMRKGVLNTKYQEVKHKNGDVAVKGPYYVLTKKGPGGKTISQSVPAKDAPRIREEVDNYKMFRELADEYVDVCEQITVLAENGDTSDDAKKN